MKKKNKFDCPCCKQPVLNSQGEFEICPNCGWEDDPTQREDPDFQGGANAYSLNEAIAAWNGLPIAPEEHED